MPILLNDIQAIHPVSEAQLELLNSVLEHGLSVQGKPQAEVSVILVDNPYIHELNATYRGVDRPTDVLSFALTESAEADEFDLPEDAPELLGDIFISVEKTVEQAAEYGHSFERELCYLAVHGLLHLVGYDHQTPEATEAMREQEEQILRQHELGRTPR